MTPSGGGAFGVQRWNAGEMGKIRSKRNRNHFLPCSAAEKRTSDQPGVGVKVSFPSFLTYILHIFPLY